MLGKLECYARISSEHWHAQVLGNHSEKEQEKKQQQLF